jgi:hypothetical protein
VVRPGGSCVTEVRDDFPIGQVVLRNCGAMRARGTKAGMLLCLAASLATFGVSTSASAYKTLSDTAEFADTAPNSVVWDHEIVSYSIGSDLPLGLDEASVQQVVATAFQRWESVACATIKTNNDGFTSAGSVLGDGVNTISWVREGWTLDRAVGAHTDLIAEKRQDGSFAIVEADVQLNAEDFDWTIDATPDAHTKELRSILLHEIGHFLGLSHPCAPQSGACSDGCDADEGLPQCTPDEDAVVMNPVYDASRVNLSEDDIAGFCALYPRSDCDEQTPCADGFECVSGACLKACGDALCRTGETCVDATCKPACSGATCEATCATNTDCTLGEVCSPGGQCTSGDVPLGEPCAVDGDCDLGLCNDGVCAKACQKDAECADAETCAPPASADTWGLCQGSPLPFGAKCASAEVCASGECLTRAPGDDVCTRTCGEHDPACPANWDCKTVDGKSVCAPQTTAATGGCAIQPRAPSPTPLRTACAAALFALFIIRRRSRARARAVNSSVRHPFAAPHASVNQVEPVQ